MEEMITIGVCDDGEVDRAQVVDLIQAYAIQYDRDKILPIAFSGAQALLTYDGTIDLLFLDIELQTALGIDLVPLIRERYEEITIIFISAHHQYFIYSHRLHVFQFLTKPIDRRIFFEELDRFFERYQQKKALYHIDFQGTRIEFPVYQIVYIEAALRHLRVYHSKTGWHEKIGQIGKEEQLLKKYGFLRCHQSFLVNMRYVEQMTKSTILLADPNDQTLIELPVSRGRQANVRQMYQQWLLEQEG